MQLTSTTDYAIRIVCYLAAQRQMISTSELSQELSVPSSYIPKITKKLKQAGIIKACEGTNGGYMLAKQPENISLMEIISGYPDGLKGNAIPMCAQVVGIVDAYDALINDRPYKRKYEPEEAIRMISNGECGSVFQKTDPVLDGGSKAARVVKSNKKSSMTEDLRRFYEQEIECFKTNYSSCSVCYIIIFASRSCEY